MDDRTVSAAMAGLTMSCGRRDGWPHLLLWAPNGWTHGGFPFLWAPLDGCTFSCGRLKAGLTEVSPFRLNHPSVGAQWLAPASPVGAAGWPHGGIPLPTPYIVSSVGARWLAPASPVGA